MTKEEILKSVVPADCWWEDMRNFTNCPEQYIHTAMEIYAKQEVLDELQSLYSLGCHSEYLREAIKESMDEIKSPRPI